MLIEFIGLPGSGKTTMYEYLEQGLVRMGNSIAPPIQKQAASDIASSASMSGLTAGKLRKLRRFQHYVIAIWRWRRAVCISVAVLLESQRSWSDKLFALRLLIVTLGWYQKVRRLRSSEVIALRDEGFLQRCFLILVDGSREWDLDVASRLVLAGPHADVVVHVKVDLETALYRLERRERGLPVRLERLSKQDTLAAFTYGDNLFRHIAHSVSNDVEPPAKVVEVQSGGVGQVSDLVEYLRKL